MGHKTTLTGFVTGNVRQDDKNMRSFKYPMFIKTKNNKRAIIILHEIYGINRFIGDIGSEYHTQGFDIYCPNMLQRNYFSYFEASRAYDYFNSEVGFDFYKEIDQLIGKLKIMYDRVFIIGFSVGATIAWRCCENAGCDGIICCYGSRIRDYMSLRPSCPVLLLFAGRDSFDVDNIMRQLREKSNVELYKVQANHGFIDRYSKHFDGAQAQMSQEYITNFLTRCS